MATEVFSFDHDAGADVYLRIWGRTGSDVGKVFDFDDSTFKALSAATTPFLACDEQEDEDGTGKSSYTAAVDLADLNSTFVLKNFVIRVYDNGTPAAADVAIGDPLSITVQVGQLGQRVIEPVLGACFTTTAGVEVRLSAYLSVDGQRYALPGTAICTVVVREHGEGTNLYAVADTANADGRFELSKELPGYTADRIYNHSATITVDGVAFTKDFDIPNYA